MPRKRKSGIDYWLENCQTCSKFIKTKYLEEGVDNGGVSYTCSTNNKAVIPHKIDGCKNYEYGTPTIETHEVKAKKK